MPHSPDYLRLQYVHFTRYAAACPDPGYRKLWQSQARYFREMLEKGGHEVPEVGISEPLVPVENAPPGLTVPLPGPTSPEWRTANEPAWARLFDLLGVAWRHEALEPAGFWLSERGVWFEVKGESPTEGEIRAARELRAASGARVYVVSGWPARNRFGVWLFSERGDVRTVRGDISEMALCNLFEVGFGRLREAFEEVRRGL